MDLLIVIALSLCLQEQKKTKVMTMSTLRHDQREYLVVETPKIPRPVLLALITCLLLLHIAATPTAFPHQIMSGTANQGAKMVLTSQAGS